MIFNRILNNDSVISSRETEVLTLISREYSTKQIAGLLSLSIHTIETHRRNIKRKLEVKNTAGMIRKGFELELLG